MDVSFRTLVLTISLALLLPFGPAFAEQVITEDFEGGSFSSPAVSAAGAGMGWVQPASGDNMFWPLSLPDASTGKISFDLQRTSDSPSNSWNTVFELIDNDNRRVLRLQIKWSVPEKGTVLYLNSLPSREYISSGFGLWSPVIYLGREVLEGQWLHLDLTWDDGNSTYRVFADNDDVNADTGDMGSGPLGIFLKDTRSNMNEEAMIRGELPPFGQGNFQFFLDRTAGIALGGFPVTGRPEKFERALMTGTVIDNFEIYVGDLATTIQSFDHDAFSIAGYSGKLVAGQSIKATLVAQSKGTARFNLGDRIAVPMEEVADLPNTYVGTYTVAYGDFEEDAQVTGLFTNYMGLDSIPSVSSRTVTIDGRVYLDVAVDEELLPADLTSGATLKVAATDANGKAVTDHELKLTMSTTDEYTGTVGGGSFEDLVGSELDVDWGGVTDTFGEVTAQYISGFAAKTILVSAKDMTSGDVGVGWVRSYIEGEVDIVVTEPQVSALSAAGSMEVSLSREWLTADGQSRSRITAVVKDVDGEPLTGHNVQFTLLSDNGAIRVIQGRTDSRGRALADYIAGTRMGQVQVEVRDLTSGLTAVVSIELRPDAPAEITLLADPGEVVTGGQSTVSATVTDANGNPNHNVDVLYDVSVGEGTVNAQSVETDEKGNASVTFTAGDDPGLVTVRGTVISREPTAEEISAAEGAVFLYGLDEDPGRLEVVEWLVEAGDEVVEDQGLLTLADRSDNLYTVAAPRDGTVSTFVAEERDRVEYGDTLGYIIEIAE